MSKQTISYRIRDSLYLSINDRCTLECAFCPKTLGSTKVHEYDLKIDHKPSVNEIIEAIDDPKKYAQIVFCGYGEPTLRLKVLLEVAKWLKQKGAIVRINTDGLANLVHKRNVLPEMEGLIDELSVSLNAQNQKIYDLHCQPQLKNSYQAMLDFLKLSTNYNIKVTATAIDGLQGVNIAQCKTIAAKIGVNFKARYLGLVG